MKNNEKSHEQDAPDSSSLNRLPDELILQILTKLVDLKTLCVCHLVSTRFSSIVLQVDTISFIAPLLTAHSSDKNTAGDVDSTGVPKNLFWSLINGVVLKPIHLLRRMVVPTSKPLPPILSSFYGDSFRSAVSFLSKFRGVKSLSIELPSSSHRGIDNSCLFKWKVTFGSRIESFLFLSPNSIYDTKGLHVNCNIDEEEDIEPSVDSFKRKVHIAFQCLKDVIVRHRMLLYFIKDLPFLEKVLITDSGKRGMLSLSGEKLADVRQWIHSASEDVKPQLNRIEVPVNVSQCYVPVMNLLVSRFLNKACVKTDSTSPWKLCPVTEVEETKQILRMIPILIATFVPSTMIAQVSTLFVKQGTTLERKIGSFEIPPASLAGFVTISMLISVVLYDRFFVRIMAKWTKNPRGITLLQRMGTGMVIHIIIMVVASFTDRYRLSVAKDHNVVESGKQVPLSIFVILPQFILMGMADAFLEVAKIEFFYDQAPESMKSLGTSYSMTSLGVGSFLSSFLLSTVSRLTKRNGHRGWILNNLNASHLDYYYAFFAVLNLLNFFFFIIMTRFYVYKAEVSDSMTILGEELKSSTTTHVVAKQEVASRFNLT